MLHPVWPVVLPEQPLAERPAIAGGAAQLATLQPLKAMVPPGLDGAA